MKKQISLGLLLVISTVSVSYAQFSGGLMVGGGYLFQRTEGTQANSSILGVEAAQPLTMAGLYGQFTSKGKLPFLVGLQVRYQGQRQSQQFSAMNPNNPLELEEPHYNRYSYVVATPYVGIRPLKNLEIAVGPEISFLQKTDLSSFRRTPTKTLTGYNVKATYYFGRLGLEAGYTNVRTSFDNEKQANGQVLYTFYNSYAYAALKIALIR
jgi:hypothetical protein